MTDSNATYLSKEKYKELEEELAHHKSKTRKEIAEKLEFAKSLGDLSENAEYHEAREEQAQLENRISQLEDILRRAEIVTVGKKDIVEVGSTVSIKTPNGKETWQIVGSEEVNLKERRISNESPLGSSLLGKKKGENVTVKTPSGEKVYSILKLE